ASSNITLLFLKLSIMLSLGKYHESNDYSAFSVSLSFHICNELFFIPRFKPFTKIVDKTE
ncbi:MAG: hypothetical protein K2W92_01305, partial [Alphaproteobacteria bacterium]|nr:hypothetical protein [Alphaproteobacteria bacterium]